MLSNVSGSAKASARHALVLERGDLALEVRKRHRAFSGPPRDLAELPAGARKITLRKESLAKVLARLNIVGFDVECTRVVGQGRLYVPELARREAHRRRS